MRPLTFDQAWIRDGRKLSSARAGLNRDVSSSDDDYPAYQMYLKPDSSHASHDATRKLHQRGAYLDPSRRGPARAASKGIDMHSKHKGNLVTFAKQHRQAVDTMLGSLSPKGSLSAAKSAQSYSTAAAASTLGSSARRAGSGAYWSSDDDEHSSDGYGEEYGSGGNADAWRTAAVHSSISFAPQATRGSCPRTHGSAGEQGGGIHRDRCTCGACSSRTDRLIAAAAEVAASGRGSGSRSTAATSPSTSGVVERQLLRDLLLTQADPRVTAATPAAASASARSRTGAPSQVQLQPELRAGSKSGGGRSSGASEPATPRVTWFSYLPTDPPTGGHSNRSGGVNFSVSASVSFNSTPRSGTAAAHGGGLEAGPAAASQGRVAAVGRNVDGGVDTDSDGGRDGRDRSGSAGVRGRRYAMPETARRPAAGRPEAAAVRRIAPAPPPRGASLLRSNVSSTSDRDSATDDDDDEDFEVEGLSEVMAGSDARRQRRRRRQSQRRGGAALMTQAQMQEEQEEQDQEIIADVRHSARRRARTAVLGGGTRVGGGGDSDGGSTWSDSATLRSGSEAASASAAAVDGIDPRVSFGSWVSYNNAVRQSTHKSRTRSGSRSKSSGGAHLLSPAVAAATFTPLSQSQSHRRRSAPGGACKGARGSGSARLDLWREAAALVQGDKVRHRSRSPAGGRTALAGRALSETSEEGFAHRVSSAVTTSRRGGAAAAGSQYATAAAATAAFSPSRQGRYMAPAASAVGRASPLSRSCSTGGDFGGGRFPLSSRFATGGPRSTVSTASFVTSIAGATAGAGFTSRSASPARSVISSVADVRSGSSSKPRSWFMTEVLRTPVGSHVGGGAPTHGSALSPPWSGGSPWAASPSQQLSTSRLWGGVGSPRRGSFDGSPGRDGSSARGGDLSRSPPSALSDDAMWRSPPRSRSPLAAAMAAARRQATRSGAERPSPTSLSASHGPLGRLAEPLGTGSTSRRILSF